MTGIFHLEQAPCTLCRNAHAAAGFIPCPADALDTVVEFLKRKSPVVKGGGGGGGALDL